MFTKIAVAFVVFCALVSAGPEVTFTTAGNVFPGGVNQRLLSISLVGDMDTFILQQLAFGWEAVGEGWLTTVWDGSTQVGETVTVETVTGEFLSTIFLEPFPGVVIPAHTSKTLDVRAELGFDFQGFVIPLFAELRGFNLSTGEYEKIKTGVLTSVSVGEVPEPATFGFIGIGLAAIVAARQRFRKK